MSRALPVILLLVLLVICLSGLMFFLAYGFDASVPARADVAGLGAPARIGWHEGGPAAIEAESEADAYAALGYVHGIEHAWSVVLWRQAAAGQLAEWFGDDVLPVDRLAHRLGLATLARESFARLPAEDRALLAAYAGGVNAALSERRTAYSPGFVLHDKTPAPWEPWHTLAVERLFAWLAAPTPSPDTLAYAGPDAVAFFEADRALRRLLHLHGFEHSTAWTVTDSSGVSFVQRHVLGASALPVLQEVSLQWPGAPRLVGASLPGTPFFPAGATDTRSWALLLHSPLQLVHTVEDTTTARPVYERLVSADGTEHLIVTRRGASAIFFDPPPEPPPPPPPAVPDTTLAADTLTATPPPVPVDAPDSTWVLRWAGFEAGTDLAAWRALAAGAGAAFRLVSGDGLVVESTGAFTVLGRPVLVYPLGGGVLVGNSAWTRYAAVRLDTLLRRPRTAAGPPPVPADDRYSTWAAGLAPPMVEAAASIPDQPALVAEALTYLRNWDFNYDRASIAASIFEHWVAAYRDSTGTFPAAAFPDTLYREDLLRYQMLVRAVDALAARHGADLSQWRWEVVQPFVFRFPAAPPDSLAAGSRLAPLALPGAGHPSTLAWGPAPVAGDLLAPAAWEGRLTTDTWQAPVARRYRFDTDRFFGRYLIVDRPPPPVPLSFDAPPERTTTLSPPGAPPAP